MKTSEVRATHRGPKGRYKKRIRMPSKLDPHLATIESWLATEPQMTALAIVRRLAAIDQGTFSDKQHSIVQRLLRSLRQRAAETVIAAMAAQGSITEAMVPGLVAGTSSDGHFPRPIGSPAEQVSMPDSVPARPIALGKHSFVRQYVGSRLGAD
jgi:hypothetical protein